MKILLTGASGFIGKALLPALIHAGHQVTLLSRQPHGGDIEEIIADTPMWAHSICGKKFDLCIHLAWITTPGIYLESPENELLADATIHFADELYSAGLTHFLGLGTCLEYAAHQTAPCRESITPISPISRYAKSKDHARTGISAAAKCHGTGYTWARLFYPYGAREHPNRIPSSFLRTLGEGKPLILKTPYSVKDWIEIRDVVSALLILAEIGTPQSEVNIGTGTGVSIINLAITACNIVRARQNLIEISDVPGCDPYPTHIADNTKLMRAGWSPSVDLTTGIQQLHSSHALR